MMHRLAIPARRSSLLLFLILAICATWALWIPAALAQRGAIRLPISYELAGLLGAWAPSLLALALTVGMTGHAGLRDLLGRLSWRGWAPGWALYALLTPPLLSLAITAVHVLWGQPAPDFAHPPVLTLYPAPPDVLQRGPLMLLPLVLVTQFFGSSLGEEPGWRGFALPRLQAQFNPLTSSLLLGLVWGLWHLPRMWAPGQPFDWTVLAWLLIGISVDSVLYTLLFNISNGSLIPALLLHTSQAITGLFLAQAPGLPGVAPLVTLLGLGLTVWASRLARQALLLQGARSSASQA